jgi:phosphoheptose isomerase
MGEIEEELREGAELRQLMADSNAPVVIQSMIESIWGCMLQRGKMLLAGNGGSAADAQHLAAECIVRMQTKSSAGFSAHNRFVGPYRRRKRLRL